MCDDILPEIMVWFFILMLTEANLKSLNWPYGERGKAGILMILTVFLYYRGFGPCVNVHKRCIIVQEDPKRTLNVGPN